MDDWQSHDTGVPGTRTPPRRAALGPTTVESINSRKWGSGRIARRRARLGLRPAETGLLERYATDLRGDVLELGSAGGPLTESLAGMARTLVGIGPSVPATELCSARHPRGGFRTQDIRDLGAFEDGQFDAVVAGHEALDGLGDVERRRLLEGLRRIVGSHGVLIFSSHNLGCESDLRPPSRNLSLNPLRTVNRLARLPRALRHRSELAHLQVREHGYGVLNDPAHDYAFLRYYVSRDHQERQLTDVGFRLLECVALDGAPVACGAFAYGSRALYYAACPFG